MRVEHSTGTCIFLYCVQYIPLCTCIYTCACRYHTEVDCLGIGERKVMLKFGNLQQATPDLQDTRTETLSSSVREQVNEVLSRQQVCGKNFNLCKFRLDIPP